MGSPDRSVPTIDDEDFLALPDVVIRPCRALSPVPRIGVAAMRFEEIRIGQPGLVDVGE